MSKTKISTLCLICVTAVIVIINMYYTHNTSIDHIVAMTSGTKPSATTTSYSNKISNVKYYKDVDTDYLSKRTLYTLREPPVTGKESDDYAYIKSIIDMDVVDDKIRKDQVHLEWVAFVESVLGRDVDYSKKEEIYTQHLRTLDALNKLKVKYLTGELDWNNYTYSLKRLLEWDDEVYQKVLSESEYEKLNNHKKSDSNAVIETTINSPVTELFNFYPGFVKDFKTDNDVINVISKDVLDNLLAIEKSKMANEYILEDKLHSGLIEEKEYMAKLSENENKADISKKEVAGAEVYNKYINTSSEYLGTITPNNPQIKEVK